MKFLVVAAFEPELVRFRALVRDDLAAEIAIEAIGVGLVDAAIGLTRCIARHAPDRVLLLGTCGAFSSRGLAIGDVVAGRSAHLAHEATSELPPPLDAHADLDRTLHDALVAARAKSVQITNTVGITVEDVSPPPNADVEHLEAFAVARACSIHSLPCGIALGVANMVGSNGRGEWRANHVKASAFAAEIAWTALATLATARS